MVRRDKTHSHYVSHVGKEKCVHYFFGGEEIAIQRLQSWSIFQKALVQIAMNFLLVLMNVDGGE